MPYPPPVPSATRTNPTPHVDLHPADHNLMSAALTDIINELGTNPSGASPTVQDRFETALKGPGASYGMRIGSANQQFNGFGDVIINFATPFREGAIPVIVLSVGYYGGAYIIFSVQTDIGVNHSGFGCRGWDTANNAPIGAILARVNYIAIGLEP